jgi:phosphatidylserine/phosphatidylglycerophosphate/cardiolipin synthase-like enzyme
MRYLIPIQLATLAALAPALVPLHVDAQSPDGPPRAASVAQPPRSLGQPPRYQFHAAGSALLDRDGGRAGAFVGGVRKPLMNPVAGLAAAELEGYGIGAGRFAGAGARALLGAPVLGLAAGADWHVTESRVDFVLSYRTAVRRGGILGGGSAVRVDWLPTRARTIAVGIQAPVFQPHAGATRRRQTEARLPRPSTPGNGPDAGIPRELGAELRSLADAAAAIRIYGNLYHEDAAASLRASGSWAEAAPRYHRAVSALFGKAAGDTTQGDSLAVRARAGLLEHVLLPYNRMLGRPKSDRGIGSLTMAAHESFARWLRDSSGVAPSAQATVLGAHRGWLDVVHGVHRELSRQWDDDRSIWLPMHLALTPSEVDEQAEIDSLLTRAAGRPFTDRNALTLLRSGDLPLEIARSIYAARDYHVLWMHDFAGIREENGELDEIGYEMVADVYLPALTEAVRRYDATGRMPAYMIFLDQFFYEPRDGRLWMTILENPLHASVNLPGDEPAREAHLRRRQEELRAAVAASSRLQADARAQGRDGLRRLVKVHVSVTNPSDFSFRSHHIVPPIPFVPDNIVRDHRKIAFYDLHEADPYAGALFLMGIGVGEHYASATWEDRGVRVRGPAALEARAAARRMLERHGLRGDALPAPLREVVDAEAVERRMDDGDYVGRALQVHNDVGFGAKHSSVTRALLYDLAQPGSVVVVPDPIWVSAEWAGMLAAAAARGAQVHVVAPAKANAPSPQAPLLAMSHEVMTRLVGLRRVLEGVEGAGALRVGLFAAQAESDDAAGRRREVREGLARAPWIREVIPFDARALAVLDRAEAVAATSTDATEVADDTDPRPPQLHQKTQLIARPGAIGALVRQPGWEDALAEALVAQQRQTARFAEQLGAVTPPDDETAMRSSDALIRGYELGMSEAERKRMSFYFTLGTQNQDPRGLMLDGEATLITSGIPATAGLVDLYYLMARTTWVRTQPEIDRLLPPPGGFMRRLARLIRPAL